MIHDPSSPPLVPPPQANPMVREIGATRPRMRPSLKYSFQEFSGKRFCLIEDPLTSSFHRIGLAEYRFLTYLDGEITFSEAYARASLSSAAEALSEREALALVGWLVETGLADFGTATNLPLLTEKADEKRWKFFKQFLNVLFLRFPLGRPDPWLERLFPWASRLCGRAFLAVWGLVVLIGLAQVFWNWDHFTQSSEGVLAPTNWLWLGLVWIGLKLVHEFWHGLVCKHFGGEVREAGVMFIFFLPVGYVDATSSWRFPSKWQRIFVASAGMYIELFLAAIAAIIWGNTETGLLNTIAYNAMFTASVVTLLFNANPLMRFDGYFILADYLEIPNLAPRSQELLKKLAKKYLLGILHIDPPHWRDREEMTLLIYGVLSLIWRVLIMVALLIAASYLFGGGGLILAIVAGGLWLGPMLWKFIDYLRVGGTYDKPEWRTVALRCGGGLAVLLLLSFFPWPVTLKAPAVVEFGDVAIIRAECPGFIRKVHVRHKQNVSADFPLISMENEEEETALKKMELRLRGQEVKSRLTYGKDTVPEYQAEIGMLDAIRKQALEKRRYLDSLELRSPADGTVIGARLDQMTGSYVQTGQEILRIGQWPANEVKIAVPQGDVDYFRQHLDFPIEIKIVGRSGTYEAILKRISGRATKEVRYPAMTSLASGPLTVAPIRETTARENRVNQAEEQRYELVEPCFIGTARCIGQQVLDLNAGERALIKFQSREGRSLWKHSYRTIAAWLNHLIKQGEDSQAS